MIRLSEFLGPRGFVADPKRVKLVRHKDNRLDLPALHAAGWLDTYQQFQSRPVFDGCGKIVSFLGESGPSSVLVGVYDVGERISAADGTVPQGWPHPEWLAGGRWFYSLIKRAGFEDLEDRLVIDWGRGALAWHQWYQDREVLEIRPKGRLLAPFTDYLRFQLSFTELRRLVEQQDAHPDWKTGLSAVGAVYLIVDTLNGQQYVGSATGNGGVWQRWSEYARTGHGQNLRLKELCGTSAQHPEAFRFSILETFSRSLARDEALVMEAFFKQKLGSRAFGLNAN